MSRYFAEQTKFSGKLTYRMMKNFKLKHLILIGKKMPTDRCTKPRFTKAIPNAKSTIRNGISFNQGQQLCYRYDG